MRDGQRVLERRGFTSLFSAKWAWLLLGAETNESSQPVAPLLISFADLEASPPPIVRKDRQHSRNEQPDILDSVAQIERHEE